MENIRFYLPKTPCYKKQAWLFARAPGRAIYKYFPFAYCVICKICQHITSFKRAQLQIQRAGEASEFSARVN